MVVVVVIAWGINRVFVAHSLASERGYATHHKGAVPSGLFTIEFLAQSSHKSFASQIRHNTFAILVL